MSGLSLYDLNSRETWQELLDEIQSAIELPAGLLDPKNILIHSSGEHNGLCREIRCRKKAKQIICGQSQQFMAQMARAQKSFVVEICEAGMAKFVVPVFRDQNYLGSITACGCMLPETEIETFFIEKATDIGGGAIAEMAEKVPTVKSEQLQQLAEDLFLRLNVAPYTSSYLSRALDSAGSP